MAIRPCAFALSFILLAGATAAQTVEVNQQNRTIDLTTQSSIEVEADLVSITVGYHNWGPTHDAAYRENMRFADQVLKAWTDAGIPQKDISTQDLSSNPVSATDLNAMTANERKERQYEAVQSWSIIAKPDVAQKLLDIAVAAGANYVSDPQWQLSDPSAAEAKAYLAALERAHALAAQMAKSFGVKVGALLYASNQTRITAQLGLFGSSSLSAMAATVGRRNWPPLYPVKLLPQKIEKSAIVRTVFAVE
jgi:uncharacterized protein YggE